MTELEQPGFDPRLDWAPEGAATLARACPVLVVVDVLRFTTAVEVAVARGATVAPRPWPGRSAPDDAGRLDSLSPAALLGTAPGSMVELASPNGATVALAAAAAGAVVLAGCLRNASAVAAAARRRGRPVGVVAAGERRPDGTLRPAVEDLLGAGAVLHALGGHPSPEARSAVAAFLAAAPDLGAALADSASGRELGARGHARDLPLAAALDVSGVVPALVDGVFAGVDPGPPRGGGEGG